MSLIETPSPTAAEILTLDPLVNGDMGAAWNEIKRRLLVRYQEVIDLDNADKGWTGGLAMPAITNVRHAPTDLTSEHKNIACVAMRGATDHEGIGGAFRNTWFVLISIVGDRAVTDQQILTMTRRAELTRSVLYPYLSGCCDPSGAQVWRSCVPGDVELEPEYDEGISLATATFTLIQPPSYG